MGMKKTYRLKNLDCAHCAAKMETALGKLDGVTGVSVNFLTQKQTFEAPDEQYAAAWDRACAVIHKIEPDVEVHA